MSPPHKILHEFSVLVKISRLPKRNFSILVNFQAHPFLMQYLTPILWRIVKPNFYCKRKSLSV